jgi:hypothetical protein
MKAEATEVARQILQAGGNAFDDWFNLDWLWAGALVVTGTIVLLS